jgi:hypothetical protein
VHRALADATDPEVDPDRRAWHLAQATSGVDEVVAAELERSSDRALARGGLAAAAAFLERAAALTPEPAHRSRRALAAAHAKRQSGAFDAALGLVAIAESGPLTELQHAHIDLLRGQIAFALSGGSDAPRLLLKAAKRFEPLDRRLARETYLEALTAVWFPGLLASDVSVLETAGREGSACIVAASARVRSAAGWPGAAAHRGIRRRNANAEKGCQRLPTRGRLGRGWAPVAVAGSPSRGTLVGRRGLGCAVCALRPART